MLVQMDVCYYVCLLICYNFESLRGGLCVEQVFPVLCVVGVMAEKA